MAPTTTTPLIGEETMTQEDISQTLTRIEALAQRVAAAMRGRRLRSQRDARRQGRKLLTQSFSLIDRARVVIAEGSSLGQQGAITDVTTLAAELSALETGLRAVLDVFDGEAPAEPADASKQPPRLKSKKLKPASTSPEDRPPVDSVSTLQASVNAHDVATQTLEASVNAHDVAVKAPDAAAEENEDLAEIPDAAAEENEDLAEVSDAAAEENEGPAEVSDAAAEENEGPALLFFFDMVSVKMHHAITIRPAQDQQKSSKNATTLEKIELLIEEKDARIQKIIELLGVEEKLQQGVTSGAIEGYREGLLDDNDERPLVKYKRKKKKTRR